MNLRQNLSDIIALLDKYPQIKTEDISKSVTTALKNFKTKFDKLVDSLEEVRSWEELRSRLVKMSHEQAVEQIRKLSEKQYAALCKLLSITSRKTKKLTARQAGELKLAKKIDDIRKQTY